jgi:hypothetical protein
MCSTERASDEPAPQRFWITRPLAELTVPSIQAQQVHRLLDLVNEGDEAAVQQVRDWRRDPFNPFLLADHRPVAYMKRVVMSYLDNLIAWGDALFATSSREALNEATQLYVLASELLGPRPYLVSPPDRDARSWAELEPELDAFSNAIVAVENLVPSGAEEPGGAGGDGAPLPRAETFYFRIPPNEKLLGYWDTVEDRLFKLRHCLGLGGEALALPLFDAPIGPGHAGAGAGGWAGSRRRPAGTGRAHAGLPLHRTAPSGSGLHRGGAGPGAEAAGGRRSAGQRSAGHAAPDPAPSYPRGDAPAPGMGGR